jgi:hypothetical protein
MRIRNRFIIGREANVVRVDFRREPDPPAPTFPGAGALRADTRQPIEAFTMRLEAA